MSKTKSLPVITTEEWVSELERIGRESNSQNAALTTEEIAAVLLLGLAATRSRMRVWIKTRKLRRVTKRTSGMDGKLYPVPAYILCDGDEPYD